MSEDEYLLASLTKACCLQNDRIKTCLPIQKGMLGLILKETKKHFTGKGQSYLSFLYRTLFCVCYYGLLRVSEVCSGAHPILANDVHIATNEKKFLFVLHTSKTHGLESSPQLVKMSAVLSKKNNKFRKGKHDQRNYFQTDFCPYTLLMEFAC